MDIAKSTPKVIREGLRARLRCDHRAVLTHGDLSPRNIIVQDNKITGLIDWEIAGWFPEYWEYVKFFHRPCIHKDWFDYASDIFSEPYIEDLKNYEGIHRWLRP
jgi:thiamine kinase-like enzyme